MSRRSRIKPVAVLVALVAVWPAAVWPAAAWADYPQFARESAPQPAEGRAPRAAGQAPPAVLPAARSDTALAAPRQLTVRFDTQERAAEDLVAANHAASPQRLVSHQQLPSLVPPSNAPKGIPPTPTRPLATGLASLGIVVGLFLLVAWAIRRGMPRPAARLPREAVEVLGRTPLPGRQHAHLVRCGNKVLLLSVTATSVETLTEIDDPAEVERLAEICARSPLSAPRPAVGLFKVRSRRDYAASDSRELDFGHLQEPLERRSLEGRF